MTELRQIFNKNTSYTYDDLILLPGYIDFPVDYVNLETDLTRHIKLKLPFISSPMDTVTESEMAIQMALQGGIGMIHNNNKIEDQVEMISRVKRYRNGFINHPFVLSPHHLIQDIDQIKEKYGFSGIPITEDGKLGSKLVGIVTSRDVDFIENRDIPLSDVMTTDLVVAQEGTSQYEAEQILKESKKGKLPMVEQEFNLISLMAGYDLTKNR